MKVRKYFFFVSQDFSDAVKCTRQSDWTIKTHIDLWQFFEAVEPHDYYTYSGSLTNPYCNEAVIWTIYDKPIRINSEQVNESTL
jgi:carbonic anhydrase